jgi:hypothetical protein
MKLRLMLLHSLLSRLSSFVILFSTFFFLISWPLICSLLCLFFCSFRSFLHYCFIIRAPPSYFLSLFRSFFIPPSSSFSPDAHLSISSSFTSFLFPLLFCLRLSCLFPSPSFSLLFRWYLSRPLISFQ